MKKVIIIGCPGSGKSTLSKQLHDITHLPLYHLDMMYWNEDKTHVDKDTFLNRLNQVIQKEKWIIDGNYNSTMELRMKTCDTIIFLDYDTNLCLEGIKERQGKKREDMPWIETKDDQEFIEFIKNFNLDSKVKIIELLEKYSYKKIYIFKNRLETNKFIEQLKEGENHD